MARIRADFVHGEIENSPLLSGATTLNSAGLSVLPVIADPDIAVLILDPEGGHGTPEIVWVTEHLSGAEDVTILRAQEGTTARQHPSGSEWYHGPTVYDFRLGTLVDVNGDPLPDQVLVYDGSSWVPRSQLSTYVHDQASPLATWAIAHNLGKWPSVTVVDGSNNEVFGDLTYLTDDVLTITFSEPLVGRALLN